MNFREFQAEYRSRTGAEFGVAVQRHSEDTPESVGEDAKIATTLALKRTHQGLRSHPGDHANEAMKFANKAVRSQAGGDDTETAHFHRLAAAHHHSSAHEHAKGGEEEAREFHTRAAGIHEAAARKYESFT
jgi:hypothetical protein